MSKLNSLTIGLVGFGNVGSGLVKLLQTRKTFVKNKFELDLNLKSICDRNFENKRDLAPANVLLTTNINDLINDPEIDVIVELIGGTSPAKEFVLSALASGKHVVTANKELIAQDGKEIFAAAQRNNRSIYFESSVGAGIPIIKTISEGVAGNKFSSVYGIINGTCNFILTEMTRNGCSFKDALEIAQQKGFAESNPTLDINGMDSTHKLAILINLAFGQSLKVHEIHTEGITHISHADIEHANSLNLTIKLLAIAKASESELEARVHPTLIPQDHPLATVHGINNAIFLETKPLGSILLSGEGAGQMAAASGVFSDLINLGSVSSRTSSKMLGNLVSDKSPFRLKMIDDIKTKFYLRFMANDKPNVLSQIAGILGDHGISINSVTQKIHEKTTTVPIIIITDYALEKMVRTALDKIHTMPIVKSKPVAIRMEKL
jgi:homoserine dehydrogenase